MDPSQPEPEQPSESRPGEQMPPAPSGGVPGVRWVLVRAIALGLLIVLAVIGLVWLVTIPVFSGEHGFGGTVSVPQITSQPATNGTTPRTTDNVPVTATIEPLPPDFEVSVSIQPKDSAAHVTVQFDGGRGRSSVKEISVKLTRPDGTVETGRMDMQAEFPEVTLQGSKGTDRVEVFVRFLSGKTYKVIDDQVPYRQHF